MAARVLVAAQTPPGPYPSLQPAANSLNITWQAADPSNYNYTPLVSGATMLLAMNTDATNPHTVTVTSVVDSPYKRSGDITAYSLPAITGTTPIVAMFGPFLTAGWSQTGAQLWFQASDATVKFAVLTV
jgi:hypothetical protein